MKDLLASTFALIICLIANLGTANAQTTLGGMYNRITTYDGLSSNAVNQTIKDNNGYLYFATSNGLDRFDGKNFKNYKHDPNNKKSISNNNINCLMLDKKNRLWIGTANGLNIRESSDSFISFHHDPEDPASISSNKIESILQDHQGRIWVGTQNYLNLYDEETQTFQSIHFSGGGKTSDEPILSLYEDQSNSLWISTWNKGLTIVDLNHRDTDKIISSAKRLNYNTEHSLSNNSFATVFEDGQGRIWAQQFNGHMYHILHPEDKCAAECEIDELEFMKAPIFSGEESTHNSHIYSSKYIQDKGLYMNTSNGVIFLDEETINEQAFCSIRNNFESIADFNVVLPNGNDLYEDDNGLMWVSTNNGVFKYYGNLNLKFEKNLERFCQAQNVDIISFHENGTELWLGTNKGLYIYDQENKSLEKVNYVSQFYETLNGIWDIEVEGNRMWLGTIAGLLYYIDDITHEPYNVQKIETPGLEDQENNNHIWQIEYIDEEHLLLATHKGIYLHNLANSTSKLAYAVGNNVFDIVKDENDKIWASITGQGLFEVIPRGDSLFFDNKEPVNGKIKDIIIFDLEVEKDNIWIASKSGIQKYNITTNTYHSNKLLDQNITNHVLGISSQRETILFITTDGLYSYNEKEDILRFYNSLDGVVANTPIMGISSSTSGNIYLGGSNGYNVIQNSESLSTKNSGQVVFTDLRLSNESVQVNQKDEILDEVILANHIQSTSHIELCYKHKFITLDFGVFDFLNPHRYSYSYIVEGLDQEWKKLGKQQSIALTNLNPGDYKIHVKGNDQFNNQASPAILNISVLAPFWQQAWFYVLSFLMGIGLINLLIQYKQKKIKTQKKELEKVVSERTDELIKNNEQLKLYIESNMKLEQFAHAASHDLKSPMRTISSYIGLLRIKLKDKISDGESQYFDYIEEGAQRLHNLVNDMLEFAKIKSDNLNIEEVSAPEMITAVVESLSYNIEEKKAIVNIKNIPATLAVDKIKFSRVIQNLVTNALKFMDHGKVPIITILGNTSNGNHHITVIDNGIGISGENQKKIFDIFSRVAHDDSYDGTGMGLAISRKIIESHNGTLQVKSKPGTGSKFIISLPFYKEVFADV